MIWAQYRGLTPDVTENGAPLSYESEPVLVDENHPHIKSMLDRGDLLKTADAPEEQPEPSRNALIERAKELGIKDAHRTSNENLTAAIAEAEAEAAENDDNPDKEGGQ